MANYIQELLRAETMFRLNGRRTTVGEYVRLRQISLDNVESQTKNPLFPFSDKKSSKTSGWMNNRAGALIANIIYREFRKLYPHFDLDNCVIDADQLITVCIHYNSRYGRHGGYIDINQINSVFHAINTYDLTPYQCNECNIGYVRTSQPSANKCPWCLSSVRIVSVRQLSRHTEDSLSIYKKASQYVHHYSTTKHIA